MLPKHIGPRWAAGETNKTIPFVNLCPLISRRGVIAL